MVRPHHGEFRMAHKIKHLDEVLWYYHTDIKNNLYTKNIPDPEILIRTGNTQRLSNFLLWQAAYTEIFFEKKLWPDFKNADLKRIMKKFNNIKRNFGKV